MRSYDHTQLKAGDPVVYGNWGYSSWRIHKTTVKKLTATQIVMADGTRFGRVHGRKVGADNSSRGYTILLDPKGKEVREAMAVIEAHAFWYAVDQWDKKRRNVKTLEAWEICLSQLEALVSESQREVRRMQKEMDDGEGKSAA